ncbi:MAG: ABC transporter substrate-binding protein [Candidatus Hodarchaeota archaeon]
MHPFCDVIGEIVIELELLYKFIKCVITWHITVEVVEMGKVRLFNLLCITTLSFFFFTSTVVPSPVETKTTDKWASDFRPIGAYVDEILFTIYPTTDTPQAMLALQSGGFDAYDERVLKEYLPTLVPDPDVDVRISLGSMYRVLVLNCLRFPTNITGYRRAMAYGMDKYKINIEAIDGAGVPLDSYVPIIATEWEVESELVEHFYNKDIVSGNASLDASGFKDLDGDGWREYDVNDNGVWDAGIDKDDMECKIELWPTLDYDPAIIACTVAVQGLTEMGIRAEVQQKDWNWLVNEMEMGNHWVICWTEHLPLVNPPKVMYDYWRSGTPYNTVYYRFNNATCDAALDDMAAQITLEGVKEKAKIAAKLLAYEQPIIVCYNDVYIDAYRIDKFDGFFLFQGRGITNGDNPYCGIKVKLKSGEMGGTFKYCLSERMDTTNVIMMTTGYEVTVAQYVYETLWNIDPFTWDPIPGLAYDWTIEQTTASGIIQDGQKFTFYLYPNATWHDGQPVTSEDVKFSFETVWPQSPFAPQELFDIYMINTPDDYTVEIYVNQAGYFEWASVTSGIFIVPKHIWEYHGPNYQSWVPSTAADMIGSGPYKWNIRIPDVSISLFRHPNWHFSIRELPTTQPTSEPPSSKPSISEPSTSEGDKISPGFEWFTTIVVIPGAILVYIKRRRK